MKCNCEHKRHFDEGGIAFSHKYGENEASDEVLTDYGVFQICQYCKHTCWKDHITRMLVDESLGIESPAKG